jgi:hypothetical protein
MEHSILVSEENILKLIKKGNKILDKKYSKEQVRILSVCVPQGL